MRRFYKGNCWYIECKDKAGGKRHSLCYELYRVYEKRSIKESGDVLVLRLRPTLDKSTKEFGIFSITKYVELVKRKVEKNF